ncbi:TPA: LysR substrate-binding domain-containing protein [Klebsiella pneumoniae]
MADFPPVASLRSFEAVARLGSVTQAAHELSVTHSAVSQHIKQLEALVGVTLFIRHGRGVRITEEGRLYALQIREALQHIADATRMVQIKPRTLEVSLATLPSFGCHWLLPRLARFQARHPQIAVRLLTSLAVVNLQQEGIDLAIRMGQGDWEGMESRHLFADEQLVVAAPGYRGGNLPIVPSGLRLNDSNLVLEAVRLGAGVALERRSLVAGAIARGELVQLTAVTVPYPWHYWLTVSPQAENRPEVARFIAWLEEEIALWRQQISA